MIDWSVGLVTLFLVTLFAWIFVYALTEERADVQPAKKVDPDYKAIADKQARAAELRSRTECHLPTWDDWLHRATMRLLHWWPSVSYDEAKSMIREYMRDVATYPDPNFDWSLSSADEVVDEYVREYGEHYGANA